MSYIDLIMYSAVLPGYDDVKPMAGQENTLTTKSTGKMNFGQFMAAMKQMKNGQ